MAVEILMRGILILTLFAALPAQLWAYGSTSIDRSKIQRG